MAAGSASLPWLEKTRQQIQSLQEWRAFSDKLCDAVQQQMNESSVKFFNDLSETEKAFVLEKAAKALHSGTIYNQLTSSISSCLEQNIHSYVAQQQQDGNTLRSPSDLVASHIQDGVINILENRPSMKVKLHAIFNHPIPQILRTLTWKLQLSNIKVRMEYLTQVSRNKVRSVLDREIGLHCETLLTKEQTLQHLKDNKSIGRCMRNVISYYHTQSKVGLFEEDYLLLVPLVQTVYDTSKPSTSLESMSTLLVEEYITFMASRPSIMCKILPIKERIFQTMALSLNNIDQHLAQTIQNIYSTQAESPEETLTLGMQRLVQPVFQQSDMEGAVKKGGTTLSVQEFQMVINKHFYQDLFSALNKGESNQFPVHDPTQDIPHWSYVSKMTAPPRTMPQDRRKAREEREIFKSQVAEKERREEVMRRQQEEEQKREEEERLNRLLEDMKRRYKEEKSALEDQIRQEQQQNYELEKRATEQINELQGEIRRLLQQRRASFGGHSVESIRTPPPSVKSQTPTERQSTDSPSTPEQQTATPHTTKEVNGKTVNTVVLDLLKQVMESADTLINGQTMAERDTLNGIMKKHLRDYKEDVKNAEIEIFGHELELNELDHVDEPKRTALSKRLFQAIKKRTEARFTTAVRSSEQKLPGNVTYTI